MVKDTESGRDSEEATLFVAAGLTACNSFRALLASQVCPAHAWAKRVLFSHLHADRFKSFQGTFYHVSYFQRRINHGTQLAILFE